MELTERQMQKLENQIPHLAESAFKQARAKALAAGHSVVEVSGNLLVRVFPDGTKEIIKVLPR